MNESIKETGVPNAHTAKPTRVAIEELQLHDLKNMDAAVRIRSG